MLAYKKIESKPSMFLFWLARMDRRDCTTFFKYNRLLENIF